ncbi:PotD/PotF family extracellular solute-binding protein [Kineosporia sp. A_224]|uniref:ABC transporter substrate-binding protein n=1 Tax=Kineosporia sp. A_224 TaxID=1962180 RepID=UPI000B4B395B|nr:substrate-binding domain-containing protein [Kineosporia sp. A_224]
MRTGSIGYSTSTSAALDRRSFLRGAALVSGAAALSACGLSSGDGGTSAPASAGGTAALEADTGTVRVLTFEGYTQPEWLDEYKAKSGVEVVVTTAGSVDEMFAKARTAGNGLDLVQFDLGSIPRYIEAGLLVPFDRSQVANVANISPGLPWEPGLTIDGKLWGLPYNWGTEPLMWNADVVTKAPTSWRVLWDRTFRGKVTLPDDSYIGMPMIGFAWGVKDPYNMNDQDFDTVKKALSDLRPQLKTLTTGFNDAVNLYGAGDCVIGYCQNVSVVNDLTTQGKNFAYGYPDEGTPFWIDNSLLLQGGNRKEVYDYVNATMDKAWQGRFIEASGNAGIISYDDAKAIVAADKLAATEVKNQTGSTFWAKMRPMVPPNRLDDRLALWNEFKAGL